MAEDTTCPIWRTPAIVCSEQGRDGRAFDSPRAGGRYFISGTAETILEDLDTPLKARLTTWLIDERRLGVDCPEVDSNTIRDAEARLPLPIRARADRFLRYLADRERYPGGGYPTLSMQFEMTRKWWLLALATLESAVDPTNTEGQQRELKFFGDYLEKQKWTEAYDWKGRLDNHRVAVAGYVRLAELETTHTPSSRAFIAMWFDDSMKDAYDQGIAPAVRDAGYEPIRIDRKEHLNKIDDEIVAEIRRARFVVADFTQGRTGARGGVYYEAGFAQGLGIPVIFCCRKDRLSKVHFDTRQYNHIDWKTPEELRERLAKRVVAVIGDGSAEPSDRSTS